MTKPFLPLLAGLLLSTGCARHYVLTMSNGDQIRTASKPKLVNGFYYFKDPAGGKAAPVFAGRVSEIAPASMASKSANAPFTASPSK